MTNVTVANDRAPIDRKTTSSNGVASEKSLTRKVVERVFVSVAVSGVKKAYWPLIR